ncbi:MAG: hypothetical protein ACHRHE_23095, partial [Tepidisphaerales bacterium]
MTGRPDDCKPRKHRQDTLKRELRTGERALSIDTPGRPVSTGAMGDAADNEHPLLCPSCGYDLRAAVEHRCSECGTIFDPAELRTSAFPWHARRSLMGYLRTFGMVFFGSPLLRHEAYKPQDLRLARRFCWITAVVVGLG